MPINQFFIIGVYIFIKFRVVSKYFSLLLFRVGWVLTKQKIGRCSVISINCQDSCCKLLWTICIYLVNECCCVISKPRRFSNDRRGVIGIKHI